MIALPYYTYCGGYNSSLLCFLQAETGLASSADIALTKQPLLNKDEASLCTGSSDSSLQLGKHGLVDAVLHLALV